MSEAENIIAGVYTPTYENVQIVNQILRAVENCGPLQELKAGDKTFETTNIFGFHHSKARKFVEDVLRDYNIAPKNG